ncbi:MAG: hypothetical protein PHH82_02305 [Candidatus ainarchaeum sp.]|nr:hypothetical protein [Candidatus ainarchaeum sp.]
MTPKERRIEPLTIKKPHGANYDPRKPQDNKRAWEPPQTKNKGPTLGEKIKKMAADFEKKRIARMRPEERELYSTLVRSKERYVNLQRTIKEVRAMYTKEIAVWRRKRQAKGSEFNALDAKMEADSLKQWKDYLEGYEDALPQRREDYETALNLWNGRKLLRKA